MQLTIETGIPALTVFMQGILSFLSPCVFPLVPLYISYLAGGMPRADEEGNIKYSQKTVLLHTIFFVLGISVSFFVLGLGFSALGQFFKGNRVWFARVGGIIMILFGLYQLGVFGKSVALEKEHRLNLNWEKLKMNPLTAWVLGFTFSFAWTPCVGPTLAGVLLMAGSAETSVKGFILIGVYILGFILPFLLVGIFTGTVLGLFRRYAKVVQYTVKAAALLLIVMGIMTLTGWMNGVTSYLSSFGENQTQAEETKKDTSENRVDEAKDTEANGSEEDNSSESKKIAAPDFTLRDQYGNEHRLSDYKEKTVFLNFWATWCGPCKMEMPDIQKLYEKHGENTQDLIVLGVANLKTEEYPNSQDVSKEEITDFLDESGYTYPTVFDESGEVFVKYGISAFPTTFMIDKDGNVYGYVSGTLTEEMIDSIVKQTMEATAENSEKVGEEE